MNPSFPLTVADAQRALDEMAARPRNLARPLVVAAGLWDPGIISRRIAERLRRATHPDAPIISVSFFWSMTFDRCRDKLIRAVRRAFRGEDDEGTAEVDAIGFSMGGLVSRYAAMAHEDGRRLRIRRLFTIGTPHRGARMAPLMPLDRRVLFMKAGSAFLCGLDGALGGAAYEIIPYVRLRDAMVGPANAAPTGINPWWVPNRRLNLSHIMAGSDPRILADIARRLREEESLTRGEPAPLPQATASSHGSSTP